MRHWQSSHTSARFDERHDKNCGWNRREACDKGRKGAIGQTIERAERHRCRCGRQLLAGASRGECDLSKRWANANGEPSSGKWSTRILGQWRIGFASRALRTKRDYRGEERVGDFCGYGKSFHPL